MYKLQSYGVVRLSDKVCIKEDLTSTDWLEYLQWLEAGNTPDPQYTQEEINTITEEKLSLERERKIKTEIENIVYNIYKAQAIINLTLKGEI